MLQLLHSKAAAFGVSMFTALPAFICCAAFEVAMAPGVSYDPIEMSFRKWPCPTLLRPGSVPMYVRVPISVACPAQTCWLAFPPQTLHDCSHRGESSLLCSQSEDSTIGCPEGATHSSHAVRDPMWASEEFIRVSEMPQLMRASQ